MCGASNLYCVKELFEIWIPKPTSFADSVLCLGGISSRTSSSLKGQNWKVFGNTQRQRIGPNWRRTDGIRAEKYPWIYYIGNSCWDSTDDGWIKVWNWAIQREDHLHINVQWHYLMNSRKWRQLYDEFFECCSTCQEVPVRMLVILGTWLWQKMVRNSCAAGQPYLWLERWWWPELIGLLWTGFKQFTMWNDKPLGGYMCSLGAADNKVKQHQGLIIDGQKCCPVCERQLNEDKNSKWVIEKPKLDNARKLRSIHFIVLEDGVQRTQRTQRKSWSFQWAPLCFVMCRTTSAGNLVPKKRTFADQSLHASLKLMSLQESVWNLLYGEIMKVALRNRRSTRWVIIILCTCSFPCTKRWQSWSGCRPGSTKRANNSSSCYADDHLLFQKCGGGAELSTFRKAVSCFEVTLTKMIQAFLLWHNKVRLHLKSRVRKWWIAGQAADAVSAYTQVKMEDAPKLLKLPTSECPDSWIRLPRLKWTNSWSSMEESVFVLVRASTCGLLVENCGLLVEKTVRSSIRTWVGQSTELGMSHCSSKTRTIVIGSCGWYQNAWKTAEYGSHVEEMGESFRFWRTDIISWPRLYVGCTQCECKPNETIIDEYRKCSNHQFLQEKLHAKPVAWSCDTEGNAKRCFGRYCELANKRQSSCAQFRRFAWMVTTSRMRSCKQSESCPMYVLKSSKKELYLDRSGRFDMHELPAQHGLELWQTIGSFDFLHSSREWPQTKLPGWQHGVALSIGILTGLRFRWSLWKLKIYFGMNSVSLRKSNVCSNKLPSARK